MEKKEYQHSVNVDDATFSSNQIKFDFSMMMICAANIMRPDHVMYYDIYCICSKYH